MDIMLRMRALPAGFIAPCLPTKTDKLPSGSQWLHEIKHDGFRKARTRPMSHGDLWFLTARFIDLKIEKAQADPLQDPLVQFCVFGVAPF